MKFKYKKMIVTITMGTMLVGFVIFSTVTPKSKSMDKPVKATSEEGALEKVTVQPKEEVTVDTTKIQKDLNLDVSKVVKDYLIASVNCDMEALEETVNDISMVDEKALQIKYEYIEAANNIECYMISDPKEVGYLVYVYRELKIKDVDTLAPGLSRVYVVAGDNGEYRVFFGADTGLETFINETDQSAEVKQLVDKVNKKMEESVSADEGLRTFVEKITASNTTDAKDANKTE